MTRRRFLLIVLISTTVGVMTARFYREEPVGRAASYDSTTGLGETGNRDGQLLTLLDYFESGRRAARDYLSKQPAPNGATLLDVAQACALACVRVETDVATKDGATARAHGSGVIVADGRYVLTAGHAFQEGKIAVRVILTDGRTLKATVVADDYDQFDKTGRDWAVLKLREDRPTDLVSLKMGSAEEHAAVIGIGYPDVIGINENGL
ncbi:MAG: serine protease, partial [Planctomycetota bacterium]